MAKKRSKLVSKNSSKKLKQGIKKNSKKVKKPITKKTVKKAPKDISSKKLKKTLPKKSNVVCVDLEQLRFFARGTPLRMLKAYLSGLFFPATILSLLVPLMLTLGLEVEALYYFPLSPILWGLWNMLYVEFLHYEPAKHHLGMAGAALGFILALYNVFYLDVPAILGIFDNMKYSPLVVITGGYYILWRFIVHPVNVYLGLHD